MNIKKITTVVVAGMAMWASAGVVSNVNVSNRYPWNGMVDIKFNLSQDATVTLTATDTVGGTNLTLKTLTEAGVPMQNGLTCLSAGDRHVVWNAATDYPSSVFQNVDITVTADEQLYMVINLTKSGGKYPVTYLAGAPKSGWAPEYKTKYLVLRKIKAGTFMMGSPSDEWGRSSNETQSEQTIDKDYYIGIFEVTYGQLFVACGVSDRAWSNRWGADYPCVAYDSDTYKNHASTFVSTLTAGGIIVSLPSEQQWEYACRAGTSTSVYTGVSPTSDFQMRVELSGREFVYCGTDTAMSVCWYASGAYSMPVGRLLPNPWGLYDMLGNRCETCSGNIVKGGSYTAETKYARAASRLQGGSPTNDACYNGFRIVVTP